LFFGTLEPRKNVGALLDAYAYLAERRRTLPPLVLAGQATEQSGPWLARLESPPLKGLVRHVGYVDPDKRYDLYAGARLLVQPSFEEGFGLPVLEAMTVGVPVVAANRGALPEVLGGAGQLVNPDEREDMAAAIARVLDDSALARQMIAAGAVRAGVYTWDETARRTTAAYEAAIASRAAHRGAA
jgi:glycosyltransferase involved in cell wall biosynthesis